MTVATAAEEAIAVVDMAVVVEEATDVVEEEAEEATGEGVAEVFNRGGRGCELPGSMCLL